MSKPATVRFFVKRFRTKKQQQLLALLNDKDIKVQANTIIKDAINEFVPMKSGALRASADVTPESISWGKGLKYAGYQYRGVVYGPNLPGLEDGSPAWRSRKGQTKHPTGRELGKAGSATLRVRWKKEGGQYLRPNPGETATYTFGYTTSGTHHHWDKYFRYLPKLKANIEITRMLKRECKSRGLRT